MRPSSRRRPLTIALGTGHRFLQLRHPVQVALVVARLDAFLFRRGRRHRPFAPGFRRCSALRSSASRIWRASLSRERCSAESLRGADFGADDWAALQRCGGLQGEVPCTMVMLPPSIELATAGLGHRRVVGVFVAAAVDAFLRPHRCQAGTCHQQGNRSTGNNSDRIEQHGHSQRLRAQSTALFSMTSKTADDGARSDPGIRHWYPVSDAKKRTAEGRPSRGYKSPLARARHHRL